MIIFLLQTLVGFGLISLHANLLSLKVMCTLLTLAHISWFWKDPWIPSTANFTPQFDHLILNTPYFNLFQNLIDPRSSSWDLETLHANFSLETVNEIIKIQISLLVKPKTLFWRPSKLGIFFSKSAYHVSQSNRFNFNDQNAFNWNLLWISKIHNRHKILLWRILIDIIPCKARLNVLFNMADLTCYICNSCVENVPHIFIQCPFVQQVLFTSRWSFNMHAFVNFNINTWFATLFYHNNLLFASLNARTEFIVLIATVYDLIWINRN